MHTHTYLGQTLRHDHPGGDQPHAYYGHAEDAGSPAFGLGTYEAGTSTSLLAEALAGLDALRSDPPGWGQGPQRELAALRDLEQMVREHLAAHPEHAAGLAAGFTPQELNALVTSAVELWEQADDDVDLNEGQQAVLSKARTAVYEDWGVTP